MVENICNTSNQKKFLQINKNPTNNPIEKCIRSMNRHFTEEEWLMNMEKHCSTSLVIRGVHIKSTRRYLYILKGIAKIKRLTIPRVDKVTETWELSYSAGENVNPCIDFEDLFGFIY